MGARVAVAFVLAALAACQARSATPARDAASNPPPDPPPEPPVQPKPRVFIGPDLNLRVVCGGTARGAVASVDQQGTGVVAWHASLDGDPAFTLEKSSFGTSATTGPSVAIVTLNPPLSVLPGATFDTVATIDSSDGSFAPGTVKVHGELVQPVATVDQTSIDFGDTDLQLLAQRILIFHVDTDGAIVEPPANHAPFTFYQSPATNPAAHTFVWFVSDTAAPAGDYTYPSVWSVAAARATITTPACVWTTTIPLHVRIVGPAGGASGDAGSDGP